MDVRVLLVSVFFGMSGVLCCADTRYEYNLRSELMRVIRNGEVLCAYEYDLAGNLKWSCTGCNTNVYEANRLNQYTTVTDSDGNVHQFTYDEDGNLVQDNRRIYIWDSASRMEISRPLPGEGGFAIRNYYDAFSRRVKKETWFVSPFGTYPPERPISTTTYVYDGNLLACETVEEVGGTIKRTEYSWGRDISGSLDGAGGVGGLVAVKIDDSIYVPVYDVGGNIVAYCNSSGTVVAERHYSPFGQMISAHGESDSLFRRLHFWFSTKYLDHETGLYYFGGRFYSPFLCRWLNRDPIGEQGGLNLYAFCRNDPINRYDKNGCAYFAYRPLDRPLVRKIGIAFRSLGGVNWVIAHEQLIFEDGGAPVNIGFFKEEGVGLDGFGWQNKYVRLTGTYDDCVMREAVERVKPRTYSAFALDGSQYNCQNYADDLRREYFRLLADRKTWCKCGLGKKGRNRH